MPMGNRRLAIGPILVIHGVSVRPACRPYSSWARAILRRMRFFNTTGPMVAEDHYCIAPLSRIDQGELLTLIANKRYFVLHAPRQTGKTSALLALRDLLNGGAAGAYRCVYANVESAQAARENKDEAMRAILGELATRARRTLGDDSLSSLWPRVLQATGPAGAFREVLGLWAEADRTPLVLLIDEIDALIGDTLLAGGPPVTVWGM